ASPDRPLHSPTSYHTSPKITSKTVSAAALRDGPPPLSRNSPTSPDPPIQSQTRALSSTIHDLPAASSTTTDCENYPAHPSSRSIFTSGSFYRRSYTSIIKILAPFVTRFLTEYFDKLEENGQGQEIRESRLDRNRNAVSHFSNLDFRLLSPISQ